MKAIVGHEGRIALAKEAQAQLGVQSGDDVLLENRRNEWIIKATSAMTGLCYEGNVLVHRGTCILPSNPVAVERDQRMAQLSQGLRR